MKLFFFDLETTGTRYWRSGTHQISGCIEIDGEVKESFDFKVCPNPSCEVEDEALKCSNVTKEIVLSYPPMGDIYKQIISMLSKYVDKFKKTDKFYLVGYNNASFDNQFLRAFFVQNGDNYFGSWFWADTWDVYVLASYYLKDVRHTMANFQQSTVAKQLGITVDESRLHDAVYDVEIMRQIFKKVTSK